MAKETYIHGPLQILIDDAFSSIKEEKKKLSKIEMELGDLLLNFRKSGYTRKLCFYQDQLSHIKRNIFQYSQFEKSFAIEFSAFVDNSHKYWLQYQCLKNLIDYLQLLIDNDLSDSAGFLKKLESDLVLAGLKKYNPNSVQIAFDVYQRITKAVEVKENIDHKISELKSFLRYALRNKNRVLLKRDLRQIFRNIIKTRFKNLDDQSGDNLFFAYTVINQNIITSYKIIHGNIRYS